MSARARIAAVAALALVLALGAGAGDAAAKKKGGKAKAFTATKAVNAGIPDFVNATASVPLNSVITVPKAFKGKVVGDVNVTGIQTTGSAAGAANDLQATLITPSGRSVILFAGVGDQSLGPWTIDDDSETGICLLTPPAQCPDSTRTLQPPFAGTSNTIWNFSGGFPTNGPLATLNDTRMKGAWTLRLYDSGTGAANGTSVLNGWGIKITPAKPVAK